MNAISRELLIQQRDAGLRSSRLTVRWRRGAARILCAWVAFLPTSLYGSTESLYEAWRWVRFTTDSGLPSDRVYDVIETPDGTVWAATEKGLAWYDGFQWHPVGKSAGLPEMRAISLTADDRDSLVVLVDGVAYMGDKQGFDRISIPGRDANTEATAAVAFGERGALILVREPDAPRCLIYQWKGGVAQPLTPQPDLPNIRQGRLWKARNGSIWVQATGGFYRWDGEEWVLRLDAQDGRFNIRAFCENSGNTGLAFVEFSFRQRGLMSWTDGGPIKPASEPADTRLISMDIKPNGDAIAVHWSHGVHLRTGGAWRRFEPVPRELQSVTFVRYRPNGDLWVGTQRGLLLHRASDTRWTHQRHGPPDRDNHVLEFLKTRRGDLWIGTGKNIEIHRRDGAEEAIDRIGETKAGTITGLAEDTEGNVWISSGYCFPGAFRWDGTSWRHFGKQDGLDAPRVHKIRNDRQGRLWLLGIGDYPDYTDDGPGAFVYEHGRFTRWGKPEGLPNGRVYAFAETTDGARWFGTAGGLSRWRNGTWTHWNRDSGLASHRVYTIAVDLLDRVWFGHQTGGLGVIDETDRPKYLTTSDGLVNNEIWDLKVDPFNRLWAATEDGLCAYQDGDWMFYHSESGLGIPRLISVLPLRDEVYVGTAGGTTILDMSAAGRHPPRVVLQSPNIGHDSTLLRWAAHAHWGEIPPNEVETRYRLDGGAWSGWSTDREVALSGLAFGEHTFQVQAKGYFGRHTPEGAHIAFTVAQPFHHRLTVLIPLAALFLTLVGSSVTLLARRRRNLAALRESEARYRNVIETTPIGIYRTNADGRILMANPALVNMLGYSSFEDLADRDLDREGYHPASPRAEFKRQAERTGQVRGLEAAWIKKDGSHVFVRENAKAVRDADGQTLYYEGTVEDITDSKRVQEELRRSEELLTEMGHIARIGGWEHDLVTGGVSWTRGTYEIVEIDSGDIPGPNEHLDYYPPEDRAVLEKAYQQSVETGEPFDLELQCNTAKGRAIWARAIGHPIFQDGKCVKMRGTFQDITERKVAERALRESEEKYRGLFDESIAAAYVFDAKKNFIDSNRAGLDLLGYSKEELFRMSIPDVDADPKVVLPAHAQLLSEENIVNYEHQLKRKDGTIVTVLNNSRPLTDDQGRVVGMQSTLVDITDRKRAEETLRAIADYTYDWESWFAPDGRLMWVNPAVEKLTGYSREACRAMPDYPLPIVHEEERAKFEERLRKAIAEHSSINDLSFRISCKDGSVRWMAISWQPIYDEQGEHSGLRTSVRNINERKQAEKELRESAERLRNVVEHSTNLFYSHTTDHVLTYVSPQARDFLDCDPEEALRRWTDLVTDNPLNQRAYELTQKAIETGERQPSYELELVGKKGRKIWVQVNETPIVQDGKTVAIVGALTDITERKHSEDALRESEERFRSLFEHAPLGYQSLDANGNFVELNETWCQVLGYTKEEVLGRNFSEFIHPDFTEHFKENFPKFKNLGYILGVEFEMIKKDGSKIVVSFDGRIGHNDDGSFKQTHCVLHDITERKRVEGELATYRNHLEDLVQKRTSELEESKARLRQAEHLASIGTLATGIAHEINNPIGAILLAAQSALVAHGETVRAEVALHEIAQHAKRCGGIVRNVLKFAQRGTPEKRPVDLNEVIGQVVNLTQKHAAENGAAIATQLAEGLPRPIANQTELGQVLINLVQNAIEADARLITIQTSQGVDSIRLTVTDDGRGIPAGERDRVFDPFFTTRHREGGTGLGLSIVHGIIEDHGGTIEIADEPGMGTTLLIGLPLLVEASGDDDVASSNS